LLGYFLAGLQAKIRNQIRPHYPMELMKAMKIALDFGEEDMMKKEGGQIQKTVQTCYHSGAG